MFVKASFADILREGSRTNILSSKLIDMLVSLLLYESFSVADFLSIELEKASKFGYKLVLDTTSRRRGKIMIKQIINISKVLVQLIITPYLASLFRQEHLKHW